ncbi:MAG: glycerol-3-phosphate 1-O-acyltransferase PlsY [Planctomycetaceae bacterium]
MNFLAAASLAALLSYLVGSLPFGLILAKLVRGIDIREHGSKNIGATNVARVVGAKWGAVVLVLDALKGALPVWLIPGLLRASDSPGSLHLQVICGITAMLGHMFPLWLGFRGGKGVATAAGIVLVLAPIASAVAIGTFGLCFLLSRIVSLSSILAVSAFAAAQLWLLRPNPFSSETWSLAAFSIGAPLLIIYRHRSNIRRLVRGEEPRFKPGQSGKDGESAETTRP